MRGDVELERDVALLEMVVDEAPVAVVFLDTELRLVRANRAFGELTGVAVEDRLGERVAEVLPALWPRLEPVLHRLLEGGEAVVNHHVEGAPAEDGSPRYWLSSLHPVRDRDSRIVGVGGVSIEVTQHRAADEELRLSEARFRSLVEATATWVWSTDTRGRMTTDIPGWRALSGQTPEEFEARGFADLVDPADRDRVLAQWRRARATATAYEDVTRVRWGSDWRWIHVRGVPAIEDGEVREWVGTVTDVTGQRRAEEERIALAERAAMAAERTAALQRATAALANAMTVAEVIEAVLREGPGALGATGGSVGLVDDEGEHLRFVAVRGYTPSSLERWSRVPLASSSPSADALQQGQALVIGSRAELLARYPWLEVDMEGTDFQTWAFLPLVASGPATGVLALAFPEERRFSAEEHTFLDALAGQCAQAVERARLFEREHSIAEVLQRSLLPATLPSLAGVHVAARYQPGTVGVEVGGDWYDAFPVGPSAMAVALGDVAGKGVRAASVMGQLRNAARAFASLDPSPAFVLASIDRLTLALGEDELATFVYGVLDAAAGTFRLASAGHLPVVLRRPDGTVELVEAGRSMPFGVGGDDRHEAVLDVAPGTTLLLCSDGLVEDRRRSLDAGLGALADAVAASGGRCLEELCDDVLAAMLDRDGREDDVTLLAVRTTPV